MGEDHREIITKKDLEKLKKEIAQKGKEIEQLEKTIEEMRTQIQGKEENAKNEEMGKALEDISKLLDVGLNIFGVSSESEHEKTQGKGLIGLITDLAALAEKTETYQKRVNVGKRGVIDICVSSLPIRGTHTSRLKMSKPKEETSPMLQEVLPTSGSIKEEEPIVDIFEEEDQIRVMVDLPGVREKEINLSVEDNTLTISTDTSERRYYKKVELPADVRENAVESNFRNGVLEVKLRKMRNIGKPKKDQ